MIPHRPPVYSLVVKREPDREPLGCAWKWEMTINGKMQPAQKGSPDTFRVTVALWRGVPVGPKSFGRAQDKAGVKNFPQSTSGSQSAPL